MVFEDLYIYRQDMYCMAIKITIVRLYRFRNPEGNPEFSGPMSIIEGYVITTWPNPHPQRSFDCWFKPHGNGFDDNNHGIPMHAGQWNDHRSEAIPGYEVFGGIAQPFSMGALPIRIAGRSATLSNIGIADNDDVGVCALFMVELRWVEVFFTVGVRYRLRVDESSIEAIRRMDFGGALEPSYRVGHTMETRIYWHGNVGVSADTISVSLWKEP